MKKKRNKQYMAVIFILLLLLSFSYGIIAGAFQLPPYKTLNIAYKKLFTDEFGRLEKIDQLFLETDIDSLIGIKSKNNIEEKRSEIVGFIWNNQGFPKTLPNIEKGIDDKNFNDIKNLERIDKITISMDYGINSVAYHFIPKQKNNKLVIYHQGHEGFFAKGETTIQFFLENGYSVAAFSMPLFGMNSQPVIDTKFGKIKFFNHNQFALLESSKLSPIKFFVEPVAVSLNYIEKNYDYGSVAMTGISGGGWTTTLYAAIDPRVQKSYPVAGTLPIFLREKNDLGDYEQIVPELYGISDYLDLYILGSYGDGRRQLQILNKYDGCCFAGVKYQLYEDKIKETLEKLGAGSFEVYSDESHYEHKISDKALNVIFNDLE